jgi:hypothetical protein
MNFKQLREKYRSKYPASLVAAAVKIALDMAGAMTPAVKKIEAMKKGLSNDPMVKDALRMANESVSEAVDKIDFPDMDDDTHATASMIAKKHGLKIVSKKGKTGNNLTVSGDSKKVHKFLKSLPNESTESVSEAMSAAEKKKRLDMIRKAVEKLNKRKDAQAMKDALAAIKAMEESTEVKEGKYSAYSDLLLMKARVIDKEGPKSDKLPAINAQIKVAMKRLGIKEDTEVKEGTWDIPDTKTKLQKLMDLVSKPFFGTSEKDVDRYLKIMPFGDDELYDDLGMLYFIPGSQKSKKFPKTDLNQVAMDSLNGRWLTAKKKGNGWDITHINFDVDMDETIKRKSGNIRPGKRMKVDF